MKHARLGRNAREVALVDQLVGARRPGGRKEAALALVVERHEPDSGGRRGREAQPHVDARLRELAREQVAELVLAHDADEAHRRPQPGQTHRDVRRRAARMDLEVRAVAQPAAPIGQQIDQRLAEATDAHGSNRPIKGTWSDLPQKGLALSP